MKLLENEPTYLIHKIMKIAVVIFYVTATALINIFGKNMYRLRLYMFKDINYKN